MEYIQIAEEEGDEPIELPTEEDGALLQTTLQAQYPGACGLKYRNEDTKAVRGVRLSEGRFFPPTSDDGWGNQIYFCVFPKENKRKRDDNLENSTAKTKRVESGGAGGCPDLIVLGLSWETTEKDLRDHFEEFGQVLMVQVKKHTDTGKSKGYGFVRFAEYEAQKRVLSSRHLINGKLCEVKLPNSKKGLMHQAASKVYVGRLSEDTTADDLREYFSKFGTVTDVFVPKPFRAFSFVSFVDPDVAQSLCGEDHIIKGASCHVSSAAPKVDKMQNNGNNFNNGGNNFNRYGGNSNNMPQNDRGNYNNGYGNNMNGVNGNGFGSGGRFGNSNGGGMMGNGGFGSNRGDNGMQGYNNQQQQRGGGGGWNNQNRGNLDMPNLQALGINPQGRNSSNQSQNSNNSLGGGLDLNQLSMNPAIVAAALNQFMSNLQNQSKDQLKA